MKTKFFIPFFLLTTSAILYYSCKKELDGNILVSTGTNEKIGTNSVTLNGQILDPGSGIKQYGHYWSKTDIFDNNSNHSSLGARTTSGSFKSEVTGLDANTLYTYMAYATDGNKMEYGEPENFTTQIAIPTMTTAGITEITDSTAVCGGTINYNGGDEILERGVCWNTSKDPLIINNKTNDGKDTGTFTSKLKNLAPLTTYFVRAYAKNGQKTGYGENVSFTTPGKSPVADFTASARTIGEGNSVKFIDKSTNTPTSWNWSFGDGGTSSLQNPSHTYSSSGTYTITLKATNSYGSDIEIKSDYIIVNAPGVAPVAAFTVSATTLEVGQSVQFSDQSANTPTTWSWIFGDGGTSTSKNPTHFYSSTGNYTVTLTATNSFGSNSETKNNFITVGAPPVAAFSVSIVTITVGQNVQFTDQSTNTPTSWNWSFGDGSTSTSRNPSHTYSLAGTYTITLTVSNSFGSDLETKSNLINVGNEPVAAFIASASNITTGQSVQFTDQSTNSPTSWSWNFGDGGSSTSKNPSHTYSSAGSYTVTLTVTNSFGSDLETKSNFIIVGSAPVAAFTASQNTIATGENVQFTDHSTNTPTSWNWNFGDGGTSTSRNPSHVYSSAGTYTVILTVTNDFGSDIVTKSNFITVGNAPVAAFAASPNTISEGINVFFTDQSTNNPTSWNWSFGDGGTSTSRNPSHIYSAAGTYTVTLTVTNTYGSDAETKYNFLTVLGDDSGTFSDIRDGHIYKWVKIGDQKWMAENLAYLPSISRLSEGSNTEDHYYVYDYDGNIVSEAKATSNFTEYGVLYNWPAAMNGATSSNTNPSVVQGVCPSAWHVPSELEWIELEMYLGMTETEAYSHTYRASGNVGGKLKEMGYAHWANPNIGATNSYGFTALPGGMRSASSLWRYLGTQTYLWTTTEMNSSGAYQRTVVSHDVGISSEGYYKANGFSVRCIED